MPDYRNEFIKEVEQILIPFIDNPIMVGIISDKITIALNDYELTERCTEIVSLDSINEKLIKRYCACLAVDGKSEKTIYQYRRSILRLSDFLNKPFPEMKTYDIRFYLASEKERGVSERSLENTRANLSAFFQWLTVDEIIEKNPMLKIKPIKYPDEIKREFSDVEIDKLRSGCKDDKERALIEFLLSTGVRVDELCQMNTSDIDMINMTVHVRYGKGGKERITYITAVAVERLKKYLHSRKEQDSEYLFCNKSHDRIKSGGIRFILNRIASRAGVTNVHPHRFRRTFATGLAKRGMDIREIQKLLGHSNINTTLEYVCTDTEGVKASYRKYIA